MAYVDYISDERREINERYFVAINEYLDIMIPKILKSGYEKVKLPGIEHLEGEEFPSKGIYDTISYIYDSFMGFDSCLEFFSREGQEIIDFKKSVSERVEALKKVVNSLEKAKKSENFDIKKVDLDKVYNDTLSKIKNLSRDGQGR